MILSSPTFKGDPLLQKIDTLDMLAAYEERSRELEREHDESSRKDHIERSRRGRRARDGFKALLSELVSAGKLTRKSMWKETFPLVEKDERYDALLGMPGSTPLDLWMDLVDDLGEETERVADTLEKALRGPDKKITLETTFEEFEALAATVPTVIMDDKVRADVYDFVSDCWQSLGNQNSPGRFTPATSEPLKTRLAASNAVADIRWMIFVMR